MVVWSHHSNSLSRKDKEAKTDVKRASSVLRESKMGFGVKKRRFLNWDPVKFFNNDDLNSNEIISNSHKIQDALQMKNILDSQL